MKDRLTLSTVERLMLVYQLRILEKLYPDEAEPYSVQRKAIEEGYTLNYNDMTEWLFDEMSVNECEEVYDILNMYRAMTFTYRDLSDKVGINEKEIMFEGFDGNNEGKQFLYTRYLLCDKNLYVELHNPSDDYNSHTEMLDEYREMLEVYKSHGKYPKLSKADLINILKARR